MSLQRVTGMINLFARRNKKNRNHVILQFPNFVEYFNTKLFPVESRFPPSYSQSYLQ
jgi:hypothetical protein